MSYCVGVDIGGTTTTVAVGDDSRNIVFVSEQFETRSDEGPEVTIAAIVENVHAAVGRCGGTLGDVQRIGLATPGPATRDGVLLRPPNFDPTLWDRFPIREELERLFRRESPGIGVRYLGDGQAAALGEYGIRTGGIRWDQLQVDTTPPDKLTSLFMAIVGTGLGGGATYQGKVVPGSQGRAGHVGHTLIPRTAFRYEHDCQLKVGNAYSTAESAVSLTALAHQLEYRLTLDQYRSHPLASAPGDIREKAKQLRSLAAEGDPLALELFDDQARALGITLLNVNYLGDYDLLVIGGGVCDLAPAVRERYRKAAEAGYLEFAHAGFQNLDGFEFSVCNDDAPVIGALVFAYEADLDG